MNKKILIIEDNVFLGEILAKKFQTAGYEPTLSTDGAEGLTIAREMKPDLILLDILLPSMNGYEILEEKTKDSAIADIPVIVISNSGQPVELSRLLNLGVKDYVVKAQFDPEEILIKVRAQFGEEGIFSEDFGKRTVLQEKKKSFAILTGKKILLVEDETFLNEIIRRKLLSFGAAVFVSESGEEALELLLQETPDIILLDIVMPGMNGFELLKKLKANKKTSPIPVIFFTNLEQKGDIERGKRLGAEGFIIKITTTPDEVAEKIVRVLENNSQL